MNFQPDPRNVMNGHKLPSLSYCDQPYLVETNDQALLCVMTTGNGKEGQLGQHVVVFKSWDAGKTWSEPIALESDNGPESSYAVLLKLPNGRLFCFYNYNEKNIRELPAIGLENFIGTPVRHDAIGYYNEIRENRAPFKDGICSRVDTMGTFVFKVSDDHGQTWSSNHYTIPVREMKIDRNNPSQGKVRLFWNVGVPFIHNGSVNVPLIKVGGFGPGYITSSEGVLLQSKNLLSENDFNKIDWQTLPDGDIGLTTPKGGGPIAEEHSFCVLSDGSFYCVYRSIDGYPVFTISRDNGHHWAPPGYLRYADGRKIKHPRAANFVWKCQNGKYLYWFHNQGGELIKEDVEIAYAHRNPAWLCGGVEFDTPEGKDIKWSQPEILLYDDDSLIRMSYPDLIEHQGKYLITETQKHHAHIHEIDSHLIEGLWNQFEDSSICKDGVIISCEDLIPSQISFPILKPFCTYNRKMPDYRRINLNSGFTIDMTFTIPKQNISEILIDTRNIEGKGFCLSLQNNRATITISDGRTENSWSSDPESLSAIGENHLVIIVDGGPSIISYIINGQFNDGGNYRQFGFGRFSSHIMDINALPELKLTTNLSIHSFRFYDRAIRVSEAIGNFNAQLVSSIEC